MLGIGSLCGRNAFNVSIWHQSSQMNSMTHPKKNKKKTDKIDKIHSKKYAKTSITRLKKIISGSD